MRLALLMARAWTMGNGYSGSACVLLKDWIDAANWDSPLPWPEELHLQKWLKDAGYQRTHEGHIGIIARADLSAPNA